MKNCVNTLQQVTHVHFDFATPKGLEITLSDKMEKKKRKKREKRKRVEDNKKETFLFIFTSSTLEVSGKKNTSEQGTISLRPFS